MSVEQIVAEFRDTGAISPETASWVLNVYRYELAQHGDDDRARRTVVQLLSETAEQREKRLSDARRTLQVALSKHLASQAETNVPFALRLLQALLGVVAGAAITTAATLLFVYGVFATIEWMFQGSGGRVRVPAKGFLLVALAPVFGGVIGGLVGWRFNFQLAKHHIIARLNTTTVFERALIAGFIIWTASTMVLLAFFDVIERPIDWWTEAEIAHALLLWLGPIFAGCLLASLVSWVSRGVTGSRS